MNFDGNGVCNVCNTHKIKHEIIDWEKKKKELHELIESYRGRYDYDCLIPFSGGKDSTFTLYYLVKEYDIKHRFIELDKSNFIDNLRTIIRHHKSPL